MGEAPGATEEQVGECFRGRAGKLLSAVLEETEFDEDNDMFICNTLLCRPPNNRKPQAKELKACRSNIEAIVRAVNPEILVPLGNFGLKWLTKRTGIMTWHGSKMDSEYGTVIPAIHPAFALRQGAKVHPRSKEEQYEGMRGYLVKDFQYIHSVITGTEIEFEDASAKFNYKMALEVEDLAEIFKEIEAHDEMAVDIETTGLVFYQDEIIGIAFSWEERQGVYIPLKVTHASLINEEIQGSPEEGKVDEFEPKHPRLWKLHQLTSKVRALGNGQSVVQEQKSSQHPVVAAWSSKRKKKKKKKSGRLVKFWGGQQAEVEELISCILRLPAKSGTAGISNSI